MLKLKRILFTLTTLTFLFTSLLEANTVLSKENFPYKVNQENNTTIVYELRNMEWGNRTWSFYTYDMGGSKNHAKLYDKDMNLIAESTGDYIDFNHTFNDYSDNSYFLEIDNRDDKTQNGWTLYIDLGKDTSTIPKINFPINIDKTLSEKQRYSFSVESSSSYRLYTSGTATLNDISIFELPNHNLIKKATIELTEDDDWWAPFETTVNLEKSKEYLLEVNNYFPEADYGNDTTYTINLLNESSQMVPIILYSLD